MRAIRKCKHSLLYVTPDSMDEKQDTLKICLDASSKARMFAIVMHEHV